MAVRYGSICLVFTFETMPDLTVCVALLDDSLGLAASPPFRTSTINRGTCRQESKSLSVHSRVPVSSPSLICT